MGTDRVQGTIDALNNFPAYAIKPAMDKAVIPPEVDAATEWRPPDFIAEAGFALAQALLGVHGRVGDWHKGLVGTMTFYSRFLPEAAGQFRDMDAKTAKALNSVDAAVAALDEVGKGVHRSPDGYVPGRGFVDG